MPRHVTVARPAASEAYCEQNVATAQPLREELHSAIVDRACFDVVQPEVGHWKHELAQLGISQDHPHSPELMIKPRTTFGLVYPERCSPRPSSHRRREAITLQPLTEDLDERRRREIVEQPPELSFISEADSTSEILIENVILNVRRGRPGHCLTQLDHRTDGKRAAVGGDEILAQTTALDHGADVTPVAIEASDTDEATAHACEVVDDNLHLPFFGAKGFLPYR